MNNNKSLFNWQIRFQLLLGTCLLPFVSCQNSVEELVNAGLTVPDGFEVSVVVDSLDGAARHLAVNDNGDIYVKLRFSGKRITGEEGDRSSTFEPTEANAALRDTDGDGRADLIEKFDVYESRSYGTEMRIRDGYLYFSSELAVYRQKLTPGKLIPESDIETIVIDDHAHRYHQHIAKPLAFDNDGHIYVAYGAPSNACQEQGRTPGSPGIDPCPQLEDHAGIWRFDINKQNQTQKDGVKYGTGMRSFVGIAWNSEVNELFAMMHGRDDLLRLFPDVYTPLQSAELPSEEFLKVSEGSDFGWPYCYYDQIQKKKVLAPEYGGDGVTIGRCSEFDDPIMGFPGHWAPNDLLFYTGDQFPERYRNGAFISFHGSTNRAPYPQAGYFICFVPFENGEPTGAWEVFANGFAEVDPIISVSDAKYRPMGIAMGPDGSLYISDTEKGKIWHIKYTGDRSTFGSKELASMEAEKSKSNLRRPHKIDDDLQKGESAIGEQIYYIYCGACHQRSGKGATGRFPTLVDTKWVTGDKDTLINIVLHGMKGPIEVKGEAYNSEMPQHSFLNDDQIAKVLTYVRSNFGNTSSAITAEEVKKVRAASLN